ncbi:helix-turn-helix transcriptional regulator [Salicibibacter cibarius]|uniref:Helix-turn-helix transcriptional regulator n=1 Tax=Salicibibacter cibarius TaxID=2743000 RepID=A0A7T7CC13_9BACI|nr:helix-turn-helix transcriptional regulator [Salicibibacter cibarius]QQK76399.1 helix-turn-helix transcriptional regulator [Salicibibacter cibarius]
MVNHQESSSSHEQLKDLLKQVPGVKEHLESFPVKMGKKIMKRRIDLGLTQQDIVQLVAKQARSQGQRPITQATISKIETGHSGIKGETYDKVLQVLDYDPLSDGPFDDNEFASIQ